MPQSDTAYLIGVIREWEKGFLEEDEYTRLIEAPSAEEARHVLVDTPYGDQPLEKHLLKLHQWLSDGLNDERVYQFVSARYDALNVATALMEKSEDVEVMGQKSELGSIPVDSIQSVVWSDLGWENIPEIWEVFLKEQLAATASKKKIMLEAAARAQTWREQLAFTPLMREVVAWYKKWQRRDKSKRPFAPQDDASVYERQKDEELMDIIKRYRFNPTGYDTVLAFWYAKELEVRTLRLLLSAKLASMDNKAVRELNRRLYRSWV